jgi:transposase InsO family protein
MKYRCIEQCADEYPVRMMARLLKVSPSGYYEWRKHRQSARSQHNQQLMRLIREIHQQSDGTYGSPRMLKELREQGHPVSRNRVTRLMRKARVRGSMKKRYRVPSGRRAVGPVAANVLDRQFTPKQPNEAWAADITYIRTDEGWLYLAVVIDLFSRRVIGWSMQDRIGRDLVMAAVAMAIAQRQPKPGLLHHSDRGSQYGSEDFQRLLADHGIRCSMSGHGNCYDNACVESFFATLKKERVYRRHYTTRREARADLFEYIEVFYNRQRRHSLLGNISPAAYESGLNNPN